MPRETFDDKDIFWFVRALKYLDEVGHESLSQICHNMGASYRKSKQFINYLSENGLVRDVAASGRTHLELTPKGVTALAYYNKFEKELEVE